MKYLFKFNEINYGRIEFEADREPDDGEIIEQILDGRADYNDTDFTEIRLIEVDGKALDDDTGNDDIDQTTAWNAYLRYLRSWADFHSDPEFSGMTPACYDEWLDCECRA